MNEYQFNSLRCKTIEKINFKAKICILRSERKILSKKTFFMTFIHFHFNWNETIVKQMIITNIQSDNNHKFDVIVDHSIKWKRK